MLLISIKIPKQRKKKEKKMEMKLCGKKPFLDEFEIEKEIKLSGKLWNVKSLEITISLWILSFLCV